MAVPLSLIGDVLEDADVVTDEGLAELREVLHFFARLVGNT